jgi:hypothetical protein
MTRDFNKQRRERNDMRPYVRKQPSRRSGEERFERPERPRLNRETVDRAWENGAQVNHADYHPRSNSSQPHSGRPYDQRQRFSGPGSRNSSGYRRDYAPNEREDADRRNNRYYNGNSGPRSRSYDNDRFNEPRSNSYRERNHETTFRRNGRDTDYGNDRSYNRREQGYAGRPARYPQQETRSSRYNGRGQRPYANGTRPETRTPSRNNSRQNGREQFEGDYERFNSFENHSERRQTGARRYERQQPEERHVTRLPDGRVLKGPRPAQRKNAQFWSEIAEDANALIPQVPQNEQAEQREQKPATRKREKKAESKSESNVPRPSQRGFKWPKPEA